MPLKNAKLDAFQQMLNQFRVAFLEEMPEKLAALESLLLKMEKSAVIDSNFQEFYRVVHSLKGSGGTYGLHIITTICHQMEDVLNASASTGTISASFVEHCFAYLDLLRGTREIIQQGKDNFQPIEQKLSELANHITAKRYKVLVVDNSRVATAIYMQALKGYPINAVTIEDGYQALHRLLTESFDMLISANEIPLLSGVALIGAVRLSNSRNRDIKAVLITSNEVIRKHAKRQTDASFIVAKDAQLTQKLQEIAGKAFMPS